MNPKDLLRAYRSYLLTHKPVMWAMAAVIFAGVIAYQYFVDGAYRTSLDWIVLGLAMVGAFFVIRFYNKTLTKDYQRDENRN